MIKHMTALCLLALVSMPGYSSQLVSLRVVQQADIYNVYVEMDFKAPADRLREILTDYANLERLNDSITSSEVVAGQTDGVVRVFTNIENCVLFFCVDIRKVEDITEDEHGLIMATIVPESSSFRSGTASWEIRSTPNGSRVIHQAKLEPDLRLPRWMGTAILKDAIRREIEQSFDNLECLAMADCTRQFDAGEEHGWDDYSWDS